MWSPTVCPNTYAVQVPAGVGLEFFPYIASLVCRADKKSGSLRMQEYAASLFAAGGYCGQGVSRALFPSITSKGQCLSYPRVWIG